MLNTFGVQRMTILTINKEYYLAPNHTLCWKAIIDPHCIYKGMAYLGKVPTVFSLHHLCTAVVHGAECKQI